MCPKLIFQIRYTLHFVTIRVFGRGATEGATVHSHYDQGLSTNEIKMKAMSVTYVLLPFFRQVGASEYTTVNAIT